MSRDRSKIKDSPSRSQKQYYRRILNAIDNIEMVLMDKLNTSPVTQMHQKNIRAHTPMNSQRTVKIIAPKSEKLDKNRVMTESEELCCHHATVKMRTKSRTANIYSKMGTPQRNQKNKENFTISFKDKEIGTNLEEDPSNKVKTIRKSRNIHDSRATSTEKINKRERGKSLWIEWSDQIQNQMLKEGPHKHNQPNCKQGTQLMQTTLQDQDSCLGIQKNVHDLQEQFQDCLMQKRDTRPEQQLILRGKMQELSYRIAKLRERQSRSAIYM